MLNVQRLFLSCAFNPGNSSLYRSTVCYLSFAEVFQHCVTVGGHVYEGRNGTWLQQSYLLSVADKNLMSYALLTLIETSLPSCAVAWDANAVIPRDSRSPEIDIGVLQHTWSLQHVGTHNPHCYF